MKETLQRALGAAPGTYQDIRWEEATVTTIQFVGRDLKEIAVHSRTGGHVRALAGGGWGTFSTSRLEGLEAALASATVAARLVGSSRDEPIRLAPVPVLEATYRPRPARDPRTVDLEEKVALARHYNDLALSHPRIQMTVTTYEEHVVRKVFASSEGAFIDQENILATISFSITAQDGSLTQSTRLSLGGSPDYAALPGQETLVETRMTETVDLLHAEPVRAGVYPVILDPGAAGVFTHEAFGHLSEADHLADNPTLRRTMTLGRTFGRPILNIVDHPAREGHPGSYMYDDEGVRGDKTYLIREGVLLGRLHSRQTAAQLGEPVTGNCRAKDYTFTPIVRMSNIYIEPGTSTFAGMVASIDDGLYLCGAAGGQTAGETFTFGVQRGYRIRDGRLGGMVRDIVLTGNLFTTLENITAIGNDLEMGKSGGCGKGGQILMASGHGCPHILISGLTIGGR